MSGLLKFQQGQNAAPITGCINDILQDTGGKTSLIILDVFQVAAVCHEVFGMPILKRRLNERTVLVVPATVSNYKVYYYLNLPEELNQLTRPSSSNTTPNMTVARQVAQHLASEPFCKSVLNQV